MASKQPKVNPLAALSGADVQSLMVAYYAGENVDTLISRFGLTISASMLVGAFPAEKLPDIACRYCRTPMEASRVSRTRQTTSRPTPFCPTCGHKNTAGCRCAPCATDAARVEAERVQRGRQALRDYAAPLLADPVGVSFLTLEERLFLGALIRSNPGDDLGRIEPVATITELVVPSRALFDTLMGRVRTRRALVIDPESSIDAFVFEGDNWRYYPDKVRWLVNAAPSGARDPLVELMQPTLCSSAEDADAAVALWRCLAVEESLEYLRLKSAEHRLDLEITDKHRQVLGLVIDRFSTAQAYNFIWRAVREAAADLQARKKVRAHALNSIAVRIQGFADRSAASGTPVKPFGREFKLPLSVMTSLLYDCVLGVGASGFTSVPSPLPTADAGLAN